MSSFNRTLRNASSKSEMHKAIDELPDGGHAVLVYADAANERSIDLVWYNVSQWQAEGMPRFALRMALLTRED